MLWTDRGGEPGGGSSIPPMASRRPGGSPRRTTPPRSPSTGPIRRRTKPATSSNGRPGRGEHSESSPPHPCPRTPSRIRTTLGSLPVRRTSIGSARSVPPARRIPLKSRSRSQDRSRPPEAAVAAGVFPSPGPEERCRPPRRSSPSESSSSPRAPSGSGDFSNGGSEPIRSGTPFAKNRRNEAEGAMIQDDPGGRLSVSISNGMTVEVRLGQKEVKIGRGREADLQLPDPSVSRLHAKVFRVGRQYFLADLRSRNGTHADGKRITQLALEDGRMFQVGPFRIHFHLPVSGFSAGEEPTVPPGSEPVPAGSVDAEPVRVPKRTGAPAADVDAPFGLIGGSDHVRKLIATIRRVAASDVPVLIEGETGSGKELVARGIHDASARRERPFIVVNCGAISPDLIESELFGHEKGAFTGATAQRKGAFELANNGTIILDEIGELPLCLQPKLLRVLEQKEIKRVGGNDMLLADVRILAATNRNLREEVARKAFREDLYFRIGAITISIPPLRERREDVAPIARHFLSGMGDSVSGPLPLLSPAALDSLISHDWPGNVRELRNAIQRAVVMAEGEDLTGTDFSFLRLPADPEAEPEGLSGLSRWEQAERAN